MKKTRAVAVVASVLATTGPAMAEQGREYRDWMAGSLEDNSIAAATVNAAGDLFGLICESDGCKWILSAKRECKVGERFPALASNGSNVYHIDLECHSRANEPEFFRYKVVPEDGVAAMIGESAKELGFVFALYGGEFIAVRFSLNGSKEALTALKNMARTSVPKPPSAPSPKRPARQIL